MAHDLTTIIPGWLKAYEESIIETDLHYDSLVRGGKYDPGTPYMRKYEIWFALEYLKGQGNDVSGHEKEFGRINAMLTELENKRGQDYRVKLCAELLMDLDRFPSPQFLFEMTPVDTEAWNDLDQRDYIEVLMIELQRDFDIQSLTERVCALDRVYREKYIERVQSYEARYPSVARPFFPERFWWRHPPAKAPVTMPEETPEKAPKHGLFGSLFKNRR